MPEVEQALVRLLASGDWGRYHGSECQALTTELAQYFGGQQVTLCCSGTIAVELALRGLNIQSGDEVLVAGYDFPGNFRAIEALGAKPVLVDLAADQWTVDADTLDRAVGPQTVAAIVSHLHGNLAPMIEIHEWARSAKIKILEDVCQAPGARIDGQHVGTFGEAAVLSFGGSKLLTSGRGGAVLSPSAQVHQRIRVYAERGNDAFPISELQAAVLRPQLERLDKDNQVRHNRATQLIEALATNNRLQPIKLREGWSPSGFFKLGWWYKPSPESPTREQMLAIAADQQLPLAAGFRGFTKRSERRCRRPMPLTNAQRACQQTVILHHPVLLSPPETINRLADAIQRWLV